MHRLRLNLKVTSPFRLLACLVQETRKYKRRLQTVDRIQSLNSLNILKSNWSKKVMEMLVKKIMVVRIQFLYQKQKWSKAQALERKDLANNFLLAESPRKKVTLSIDT